MKKRLIDTVRLDLTATQRARLLRIDEEDLGMIVRLAEKELREKGQIPIDPEIAMYGLRQYYALAALNPRNLHSVSLMVDPYWHAHVLYTAKYARFCEEVAGYFMHHIPLEHEDKDMVQVVYDVYGYTLDVLRHIFGEENLNSICWPTDATKAEMVCLHALDQHSNPESIFTSAPEFAGARQKYGELLLIAA